LEVLYLALTAAGFALGLALGRWWALGAGAAVGVWAGVVEDVEVAGWYVGLGYGLLVAVGTAAGVLLRRRSAERRV
jgi:hypothetical protein